MTDFEERTRYARHLALPEIGEAGQDKLKHASVLIAGVGGLGSPAGLYLAAAGVGRIGLVDEDRVSLSNLQRQILYSTAEVGYPKVIAARDRLQALNPSVVIEVREERLSEANIAAVIAQYDVIIDGTDNFSSRYLINDACVLASKPLAYGALSQFDGQASFFMPGGPCYRCLFPAVSGAASALNCEQAGVLGVLPGLIGMIQATEVLKHLLGIGTSLSGRLLCFDALRMSFDTFKLARRSDCEVCGDAPSIHASREIAEFCETFPEAEIHPAELARAEVLRWLIDLRSEDEFRLGSIPGARRLVATDLLAGKHEFGLDDELIVYCRSGAGSRRVVEEMRERGFARVKHLRGGFAAWLRERTRGDE